MSDINASIELIEAFGPNCLLGICCPPSRQKEALASAINESDADVSLSREDCLRIAGWLLARFDLAPKDTITPLLRKAGQLALNQ